MALVGALTSRLNEARTFLCAAAADLDNLKEFALDHDDVTRVLHYDKNKLCTAFSFSEKL